MGKIYRIIGQRTVVPMSAANREKFLKQPPIEMDPRILSEDEDEDVVFQWCLENGVAFPNRG